MGSIDVLIYSVAAPRRTDPLTGMVYHSAVKPIGAAYTARNVAVADGLVLREAVHEPATDAEIEATVKVMGGEDWASWVTDLAGRGMLAPGFQTVALTYVGSELTAPIYRQGTIGRAKDHLEATAAELTAGVLAQSGGTALTSVNCAAVTLSSLAIPGISLYLSLLRDVVGNASQSPVRQSIRLWDYLTARARRLDRQPGPAAPRRLRARTRGPGRAASALERWHRGAHVRSGGPRLVQPSDLAAVRLRRARRRLQPAGGG